MSNKNKKRILTLALVIALLATVIAGGSLAWFTAEAEAENVFTVGSVKIDQKEQQYDKDGNLEKFQDGKTLLPIVNTADPSADPNYQDKIVTVESTGDNPAYIRTHIAVPTALVGYIALDLEDSEKWGFIYSNEGVMVDGVSYTVYTYLYSEALTKEAPVSDRLLNGVYLYPTVDVQDDPSTEEVERVFCKRESYDAPYEYSSFVVENADGTANNVVVLVATQACQSEGFTSAQQALDAAFGEKTVPAFKQ